MTASTEREDLLKQGEQEYDEAVHQIERQEYDLVFNHFQAAEQIFSQLQDHHWLTFLYHEKFRIYLQTGDLEQALALTELIIAGYQNTGNKRGLALIHIHKADILGDRDEPYQALGCLRIAEAILISEKIFDLAGYLYSSLSIALMSLGEYVSAIQTLQTAMENYPMESSPNEIAWCLKQTGICYQNLIDLQAAERYFVGSYQSYFKAGDNEAGHDVIDILKKMYITSNQVNKLSGLENIGRQKRF